MAWFTTDEGKHVNTDWFDEEEKRKYAQIEQNEQEANKMNGKEGKKESVIERNEDGEILFKCSVTDEDGTRKVGLELSAMSQAGARNDLQKNGYRVTPRTLLPKKLFDHVMNNTNGYKCDWEDAQKEFKTELSIENSIQKAFDKANLIGEDADLYKVIYSYKALRELPQERIEKIYEQLSNGLFGSKY